MPEIPSGVLWTITIGAVVFAVIYFLLAACRESRFLAIATLGAVFYAIYFERANVGETHDYFYVETPLMVGAEPGWVPLSICISWASIFYVTTKTADLLAMPWYQRPLFAGLIAVLLDFVGDPIMSARCVDPVGRECFGNATATEGGVGLWIWSVPPDSTLWMNVPLGNFVGWIVVVTVYSFAVRLVDRLLRVSERGFLAQLLTVAATVLVAGFVAVKILRGYSWLADHGVPEWLMLGGLLAIPSVLLVREWPRLVKSHPLRSLMAWSLLALPLLSLLSPWRYFVKLGVHRRTPMTQTLVMAVISLLALFLFALPYLDRIARRAPR